MIMECSPCKPHKFQDDTYGRNKRVHNVGKSGRVCTVCEKKTQTGTTDTRKGKK